jgi:hypothetical protein
VAERTVTIKGLAELQKKLDFDVLASPYLQYALTTFQQRIDRVPKKAGLGMQRNTLMSEAKPLSLTTTSTLKYPRTKGTSWGKTMYAALNAMAPRVMNKVVQRIEAAWAISTRGGLG